MHVYIYQNTYQHVRSNPLPGGVLISLETYPPFSCRLLPDNARKIRITTRPYKPKCTRAQRSQSNPAPVNNDTTFRYDFDSTRHSQIHTATLPNRAGLFRLLPGQSALNIVREEVLKQKGVFR
ncbi:hypothetical protein I7I53_10741 [Histoplasma capsulatum var. duboisii H88]|uniref:Uncharacterized protein n=1 Tax=Ajellomyces capsulatus (strain H88) TaxID=544711 RepID=A0A8A1LED0_AJEC8|nr:hypothetical protein I7I53_10741 [Histoplasma capsulatum var. duboisii H88]